MTGRIVVIIGSGPAGFYAAEELLRHADLSVDMIDRLPTPFGLVRAGIAPDHQKTKLVIRAFERTATSARYRFFGNIEVGRDIGVAELLAHYDAVILAHGASGAKTLKIPGEQSAGVVSANEFVAWYNGHPDFASRDIRIPAEVVVVGHGNVAADIARVLLMPIAKLSQTDIARHALDTIVASGIRTVHLAGRKGPGQSRFTSPELKELINLTNVDVEIADGKEVLQRAGEPRTENAKRNLELFQSVGERTSPGDRKRLVFHFHAEPERIEADAAAVRGIIFRNVGKSQLHLACGLVITSIGNEGRPMADLPFDTESRSVPHVDGRVHDGLGIKRGLYVTGWAKRGASGTVGTNRLDSLETCAKLIADLDWLPARSKSPDQLHERLKAAGCCSVSYGDWLRIDEQEIRAGGGRKPREKFVQIDAMLRAIADTPELPPAK